MRRCATNAEERGGLSSRCRSRPNKLFLVGGIFQDFDSKAANQNKTRFWCKVAGVKFIIDAKQMKDLQALT